MYIEIVAENDKGYFLQLLVISLSQSGLFLVRVQFP